MFIGVKADEQTARTLTKAARLGLLLLVFCCFQPSACQWPLVLPAELNCGVIVYWKVLCSLKGVLLAGFHFGLVYLRALHAAIRLLLLGKSGALAAVCRSDHEQRFRLAVASLVTLKQCCRSASRKVVVAAACVTQGRFESTGLAKSPQSCRTIIRICLCAIDDPCVPQVPLNGAFCVHAAVPLDAGFARGVSRTARLT